MAIIKSMGVGAAKKSMGNVTYRTVRGRTIGSQKVGQRDTTATRAPLIVTANNVFGMISLYMAEHASDIQVSFNRTKFGSQRNYFMRENYAHLKAALDPLASLASATLEQVTDAISAYCIEHPTTIYRVKLGGFPVKYLGETWDSTDNPVAGGSSTESDALGVGTVVTESGNGTYSSPTAFSLNRHTGAVIVRLGGKVKHLASVLPDGITAGDVKYLNALGEVVPVAITDVLSKVGRLEYTSPSIDQSSNIVGLSIKGLYCRLTSAYTFAANQEVPNPGA